MKQNRLNLSQNQIQNPDGILPRTISRRQFTHQGTLFGALGLSLFAGCSPSTPGSPATSAASSSAKRPMPMPVILSSNMAQSAAGAGEAAGMVRGPALTLLYQKLTTQMHAFATGPADSRLVMYVVFDPMCPHCGHVWASSVPLWNRIKFVWIPVPLMGQDSMNYGSLIMGSIDPSITMNMHEEKQRSKQPRLDLNSGMMAKGKPAMEHNQAIAREIRLTSVPLILTRRASGEILSTGGGIGTAEIIQFMKLEG